jgi:hypothetical protein
VTSRPLHAERALRARKSPKMRPQNTFGAVVAMVRLTNLLIAFDR